MSALHCRAHLHNNISHSRSNKLTRNVDRNLDNRERMLIRVLLPNEEGLFNADCSVALLLDTIKKRHQLSRQETIDLSSTEGNLKHLWSHLSDNAATFFELRELCIVVKVQVSTEGGNSVPSFVPALAEYSKDEDFIAALNSNIESHHSSGRSKNHKRLAHSPNHRAGHGLKPPTPDGGKSKVAASARGRRHGSFIK